MTQIRIPDSLTELTPRWMTEVLKSCGALPADSECVALAPRRIGEGVGIMGELRVVQLHFDPDPGPSAPSSVVVKMPSPYEENREQAINLGMYEAEVRFYRELADQVAGYVPIVHLAQIEPGTAEFVVVMEDLSHLELVDQSTGMSVNHATAAVRALADVHGQWWGKVDRPDMDWMPSTSGPRLEMVAAMMPTWAGVFVERLGDHLPAGGVELAEWFGDNVMEIYQTLAGRTPTTLIHSDFRVENLLFGNPSADEVIIIDWQSVARGPGASDVGYLLGGSMQTDQRRKHERGLVAEYSSRLATHGVEYDTSSLWDDYRLAQTAGIAISVLAGATLDLANERGLELISTMSKRHFTAALDLDSRSALG